MINRRQSVARLDSVETLALKFLWGLTFLQWDQYINSTVLGK